MTFFGDTFVIKRTGIYSDPIYTGESLPIVYGNMEYDTAIWEAPCIDQYEYIYCYAAHPVLQVGLGNNLRVFVDDEEVDRDDFVFTHNFNFQDKGEIAVIAFKIDQGNSSVRVSGQGKADLNNEIIMDNIVDIIEDFLLVENDFLPYDIEQTTKTIARDYITYNGFKAAGVINEDGKFIQIIQEMVISFLGSVFLSLERKLIIKFYLGTLDIDAKADVYEGSDFSFSSADLKSESLINSCPASFGYNYIERDFPFFTHKETTINNYSRDVYGLSEPEFVWEFKWCWEESKIELMQTLITTTYGEPIYEINLDFSSLDYSNLDIGDMITVTTHFLIDRSLGRFDREACRILSLNPDYDSGQMSCTIIDLGYALI
jgi:hypothetical protein